MEWLGGTKDHCQAPLQMQVAVFFLSLWMLRLILLPSSRIKLNNVINKIFPKDEQEQVPIYDRTPPKNGAFDLLPNPDIYKKIWLHAT